MRCASALAGVVFAAAATSVAAADLRTLEGRLTALEQRVAQGSAGASRSGQGELVFQLQQLQEEVRALRGQVEQNARQIEQLHGRQRDLYLDLDRRLVDLEGGGSGAPAGPPAAPVAPLDAPPVEQPRLGAASPPPGADEGARSADRPAEGGQDEQALYRAAYEELRVGRYEAAVEGFRNLLEAHPEGDLADNAQYWIGESYYVTRQYDLALREFEKVVRDYPESPKAADAQLKMGFVHYNRREFGQARANLSAVLEKWPDTPAARLAQSHLRRMQDEGV